MNWYNLVHMNFLYWLVNQFGPLAATEYDEWYFFLVKPVFAPEPQVFGIAWGIIYPLIVAAFLWAIFLWWKGRISKTFLAVFVTNIVLNLTFSAILLTYKNNFVSMIHILLVLGTLAWLQAHALKQSRIIFFLLVPYLLWGTFATALQISIFFLN